VRFRPLSAAAFAGPEATAYDIIPGVFDTSQRRERFAFSIPLHRIGLQGVCLAEKKPFTKEQISKQNYRLLVQPGEVGWEYVKAEFRRVYASGKVVRIDSTQTKGILDMLLSRKYDLAIADEVSCLHFVRESHPNVAFRLAFPKPPIIYDACIAVNKALDLDLNLLNDTVREVRNEPEFLRDEARSLSGFEHIEKCSLE
jgi:hypothetical protein